MRPRIALVEFVVKDENRRERVTEILLEIEAMTFEWQRRRRALQRALLSVDADPAASSSAEETIADLFHQQRELNLIYLGRYADLQRALRETLTADEFAKLDRIK